MKKNKKFLVLYILTAILFCVGTVIGVAATWIASNFTVGIQEILFTLNNPMNGANTDVVSIGLKACLPLVAVCVAGIILILCMDYRTKIQILLSGKIIGIPCKIRLSKWMRIGALLLGVALVIGSAWKLNTALGISDYLQLKLQRTTIYEEYYVDPAEVTISAEKPKNLIYIYMESMETNFQSKQEGGVLKENLIPHLTQMAKENISFSHNEQVGGFRSLGGTYWTTGALLGSGSGVPFSFPVEGSSMNNYTYFAPGLTTMGDILEEKGYNQVFLCGSDSDFGGRKSLYTQHGNFEIFDLFTAREKGYIPKDYFKWWGFEDEILYKIAKDELNRLSKAGQPFNLTMLTVDTHMVGGYVCDLCGDTYPNPSENVFACADKQVYEFVKWCRQQPFFEDTVIVISGDHMCRDTTVIGSMHDFDHTVYNCFINADAPEKLHTKNRDFCSLDMFPTVLSAMGFTFEGDRLGLGTNLFSDAQTLAEEMGIDVFTQELYKYSEFYMDEFAQ